MNPISELTCPLTSDQTFTLELTYLEIFSHMWCTTINDHKGMNWVMNPMGFCDDMTFSVMLSSGQSLSFIVSVT